MQTIKLQGYVITVSNHGMHFVCKTMVDGRERRNKIARSQARYIRKENAWSPRNLSGNSHVADDLKKPCRPEKRSVKAALEESALFAVSFNQAFELRAAVMASFMAME